MAKRARKTQKTRSRKQGAVINQELAVVASAETMEEAKEYETLLKDNEIPAMVRRRDNEFGDGKSYAVLVPDELVDEAHVIIESQNAYDDFYDLGMEDEPEEDLEGDIFEEGS